jgi:hypothetical protein
VELLRRASRRRRVLVEEGGRGRGRGGGCHALGGGYAGGDAHLGHVLFRFTLERRLFGQVSVFEYKYRI